MTKIVNIHGNSKKVLSDEALIKHTEEVSKRLIKLLVDDCLARGDFQPQDMLWAIDTLLYTASNILARSLLDLSSGDAKLNLETFDLVKEKSTDAYNEYLKETRKILEKE